MDNFVVSARKYRPQRFDTVVGQQSIASTLKLAIQNNKLASAYLFCGPRGVGKTTCARIFAKTINCMHLGADGEACNECDSCRSFNEQRSINIQELNAAANNSVDDIRAIIDQVRIPPQMGRYKVIILDEVHMLSQAAGNALLKTLEEPPSYVVFILATTEKQKIMPTILSRCQIFDFNRMEIADIVGNLKNVALNEGIPCEEAALNVIAEKADGGMRDALSIFDQVNNFSEGNITYQSVLECINALDTDYYFRMTDMLVNHNVVDAMVLFNEVVNKGFNGGVFIGGLASHLRNVLVSHDKATMPLLNTAENLKKRYAEQASKCSLKFLYFAIRICDRCSNEYKTSYNKRLSVEITLIEAAQYNDDDSAGAGLGPATILKPLFKHTAADKQTVGSSRKASAKIPAANLTATNAAISNNSSIVNSNNSAPTPSASSQNQDAGITSSTSPTAAPAALTNKVLKIGAGHNSIKQAIAMAKAGMQQSNATPSDDADAPSNVRINMQPIAGGIPIDADAAQNDNNEDTDNEEQGEQSESNSTNIPLFTNEQLKKHWQYYYEYVKKSDPPMGGRMEGMPISCKNDSIVKIALHNEMVLKDLAKYLPHIEQFLQQHFQKPELKVETEVMPPELVQIIVNPKELMAKMRKENPQLDIAIKQLGLEIC